MSNFILFLRGAFAGLSLSFSFADLPLSSTCFYRTRAKGNVHVMGASTLLEKRIIGDI